MLQRSAPCHNCMRERWTLPRQPGRLLGRLHYFTDSVTKAERCDILARLPLSDPIGQADEYAMPGPGGDRWLLWAPWGVPSWAARGHFKRGAGALQSLLRINRVYGGRVHYTEEATPDPVSIMPGAEGEVVGSWRCLETQVEAREWRVPQRPKQP